MTQNDAYIGSQCRKKRLELGIKLNGAAKYLGVSRNMLWYYEKGIYKISVERLQMLAWLYETDITKLLPPVAKPPQGKKKDKILKI